MRTLVIGSNGGVGAAIVDELINQQIDVAGATLSGKDKYHRQFKVFQFNALNRSEFENLAKYDVVFGAFNASEYTATAWEKEFNLFIDNFIAYGERTKAKLVFIDNLYTYQLVEGQPISETSAIAPHSKLGHIRQQVADKFIQAAKAGEINGNIVRGSDLYGPYSLNSIVGDRFFEKLFNSGSAEILPIGNKPHMFTYTSDFAAAAVFCGLHQTPNGEVIIAPVSEAISYQELVGKIISSSGISAKQQIVPKFILTILGIFTPVIRTLASMSYEWESSFIVDFDKYKQLNPSYQVTSLDIGISKTIRWFKTHTPTKN